jgi:voltage-gated potassium channel Kch
MSLLRRFGEGFAGFLFITLLYLVITSYSLMVITAPSTLEPVVKNIVIEQNFKDLNETELNSMYFGISGQCAGEFLELPMRGTGLSLTVDCAELNKRGVTGLPDYVAELSFNSLYNQKLPCEFPRCFFDMFSGTVDIQSLFSAKANKFYEYFIYVSIVLLISSVIMMYGITRSLSYMSRALGWIMITAGLPLLIGEFFRNFAFRDLPPEAARVIVPITNSLGSIFMIMFVVMFVIGIALLSVSYFIKPKIKEKKSRRMFVQLKVVKGEKRTKKRYRKKKK